jgi:hypothetical protein
VAASQSRQAQHAEAHDRKPRDSALESVLVQQALCEMRGGWPKLAEATLKDLLTSANFQTDC